MSDNETNQISQIRELLFGEQLELINVKLKELTDKFNRELGEAKAEIRAEYNQRLAVMEKIFTEADKTTNSNMVSRSELAQFLTDIASKLNG
ncbi:MAG: hypothetical protein LBH05_01130 [Deferribacteraceae bacterium]|jgi:hypothetical protein|nr:hypothetical protein [Deferribacteraceae bacterium]